MSMITLGPTTIQVPALCIGTWAWGDQLFWAYGKDYGKEQVEQAFYAAIEAGITFFDTAEVYGPGESERLLGEFIRHCDRPVQIATKYGPLPWRLFGSAVDDALRDSLFRLQLSRVDLYQVHWPFTFLMSQETLMDALARQVQAGRIGAVGVSNYSAAQMQQAHDRLKQWGVPLAANQVRYSLLSREIERNGILAKARELGVTILAYSPLAQGLLTGKYKPDQTPELRGARSISPKFKPEGLRKIAPLIRALEQLGETHDRTPAQVALNWLIAQGNVIPIPGAKTADQATQNAGALGWSLTEAEVAKLTEVSEPLAF